MTKKIYHFGFLLFIASMSFGQQWSGSNNLDGNLYRNGNIGIGTSAPTGHLSFGIQGHHITIARDGFVNKVIPGTGWTGKNGDYTDIRVPGAIQNNALLRLQANGNVGIGTNNPLFNLHVANTTLFQQKLESSSSWTGLAMKSAANTKQLVIHYGTDGSSGISTNEED